MIKSLKLNSIARRIEWGYYVPVILVAIGFVLFAIYLSRVESLVSSLEKDSKLLDTVLEIRRYEKNWILYKQKEDYETVQKLIGDTHQILLSIDPGVIRSEKNLSGLENSPMVIKKGLGEYQHLLSEEFDYFSVYHKHKFLDTIREKGKLLLTHVEARSIKVRHSINEAITKAKVSILLLLVSAFAVALVFGKRLSQSAVQPLQQIVDCTKRVADGEKNLTCISVKNMDLEEVQSVMAGFTTMLEKLEQREKRIIKSEKLAAVGTLVAGVAHELNNPISNAGTSAQILIEELRDSGDLPKQFLKEMLEQITEQTERARSIVRSLLEFSREKSVYPEMTKMSTILGSTLDLVRGEIPTNVETRLEVESDNFFLVDKQRIQQALVNLLLNAFYTLDGKEGARIRVRGNVDEQTNKVTIEVEDNGPGIPPDIKKKIFDPFFTTKDVGDGSGLGLAITREIVDKHGGDISVESAENSGAKFTIILPLKTNVLKENHS